MVVLVALYLLGRMIAGKGERNFDSNILTLDTAVVDKIVMTGKSGTVTLTRDGSSWKVEDGQGNEAPALKSAAQGVIGSLASIQSQRIITTSPDKWADYEVTDTSGTQVIATGKGKTLADLMIGRFAFNQATRSGTSYVRKSGENAVYAVDGFLSMSFTRDFNSFRDKTLAAISPADVKSLTLQGTGMPGNYALIKDANGQWAMGGTPLDSASVANYLSGLRFLNGTNFADDFRPTGQSPAYALDVTTNQQLEPVHIECYQDAGAHPFVFHSSVNPQAYFSSDSSQLYQTVIRSFLDLVDHDQ